MNAPHFTEANVLQSVSVSDAYRAVRQAHIDLTKGAAHNVVRTRARSSSCSIHALPAASETLTLGATKVYSATRNGMQSLLLLFDLIDGGLRATIEANELGRLRTCAASAVALDTMLAPGPYRVGIIGTGFQGVGIARALADTSCSIEVSALTGFSRREAQREKFLEETADLELDISASDNAEELARSADILVLATTASQPVVEASWLEATKALIALGSNSLARRELPGRAVTASSSVIVDAVDVAQAEAGDLLSPIENGKLHWSDCIPLGELLTKRREIPKPQAGAYSFFCSQGLGIQDLYTASLLLQEKLTT